MSEVIYREAAVDDVSSMLQLWRQFWRPQPYESNLRRKMEREPDLVCVADLRGAIVGTIIGGFDNWWPWIYRVAVHPAHQRQGIGTGLMREMQARLAARGADAACLFISPSDEKILGPLNRLGYKERDDRRYSFVFEQRPNRCMQRS